MYYPVEAKIRGLQMTREKIKLSVPVVVEGKYDKMKLSQVIDADIVTTDGFGIFKKSEKLALIKALSKDGVVLLCDSDGAGGVIRRHVMSAVPKDKIYNLYIPKIEGKERRKKAPSKEGTLGVEGMDPDMLFELFSGLSGRLGEGGSFAPRGGITKALLFEYGLTGCEGCAARRDAVAAEFSLPDGMTPGALLGALNILTDREDFISLCGRLRSEGKI